MREWTSQSKLFTPVLTLLFLCTPFPHTPSPTVLLTSSFSSYLPHFFLLFPPLLLPSYCPLFISHSSICHLLFTPPPPQKIHTVPGEFHWPPIYRGTCDKLKCYTPHCRARKIVWRRRCVLVYKYAYGCWKRIGYRTRYYIDHLKCSCTNCNDIKSYKRCVATRPCPNTHNPKSFCYWKYSLPYGKSTPYPRQQSYPRHQKYDPHQKGQGYGQYSSHQKYDQYQKGQKYDSYQKGQKYDSYQKGQKYDSYQKGQRYGQYSSHQKYDPYQKGQKYDSYQKGQKYDSYQKGQRYGQYSSHQKYDPYQKGQKYDSYQKGQRYDSYQKGQKYDSYQKGQKYDSYQTHQKYPATGYTSYPPSGSCECCTPFFCKPPKVFNKRTCSCVCPVIKCPYARIFNPKTCGCDCPPGTRDVNGKCVGE